MKRRGWGPFKEQWYSFCSTHREHDEACPRCRAGIWRNVYAQAFNSFVFRVSPRFWRWWVNR